MIGLRDLVAYCDEYLHAPTFADYCPNGLQLEGKAEVARIVTGVTASAALIEAALDRQADALLVHHGWFWKGENPCLVGVKGRRARALFAADVSMIAYHLPLDAHPDVGNNVTLGRLLDLLDPVPTDLGQGALWQGRLAAPCTLDELQERVAARLGRRILAVSGGRSLIERIAWCSGGGQGYIEAAAGLGVDAFLSGEISEQTTHLARELGVGFLAAGHHATERYGIQALGEHLARQFGLEHVFVDIDNPA